MSENDRHPDETGRSVCFCWFLGIPSRAGRAGLTGRNCRTGNAAGRGICRATERWSACERLSAFLWELQGAVQLSWQGCGSAGASPSRHRLLPESQRDWTEVADTPSSVLASAMVSPAPAPKQSAHATPAPTRSWTTSSGEILKPEDTGFQTTDPDENGFVGR
jgi:hypothetical protein